jgi:hypothetical protein
MAMHDNHQDPDLDDIKAPADSDTLLDPEVTMQCMQATMGYHVTLHKIISRKLVHANNAVKQRIAELESEDDVEKAKTNVVRLDKYRGLLTHLKQLKIVLEEAQLEIVDLEHMDDVFHMLPGRIKHYYEHMISLDQELVELIAEVSSAEYQAAYKRAQKIIDMVQGAKIFFQAAPCMTNMPISASSRFCIRLKASCGTWETVAVMLSCRRMARSSRICSHGASCRSD